MSNIARISLRKRVKRFFKPKVLSTLEVDLPKRLPYNWPGRPNDFASQSDVFDVDLVKLVERWRELHFLFDIDFWNTTAFDWDPRNVMCAIALPKGHTKLVVHRRRWLKWTPNNFRILFLFFDCHFILRSALKSSGDNGNLDSILTWPVPRPAENNGNAEYDHAQDKKALLCISLEKYNKHILNKHAAKLLKYAQEDSALPTREHVVLEAGYGTIIPIQEKAKTSNVQYILCCQGLKHSEIVDMVLKVAEDVGSDDGNVALTCPCEATDFMEDLLGLRASGGHEDSTKFFGRRLANSVEVHDGFFVRFGITKDALSSLAAVINLFRKTYGPGGDWPGMEDLFDAPYSWDEKSGETRSFMWGLKRLEADFMKRKEANKRIDEKQEADELNEALCEAGKAAGMKTKSLKREPRKTPNRTRKRRAKPPMVVFVEEIPYKIIWHTEGRTVIKKEHEIQFTGTGVKVHRTSMWMWLALLIGIVLVVGYFVYRGLSSDVSFEDLLQTGLSIAALYAATIIPLVYYLLYNNEDLADVLAGRVHLDKRSEFDLLPEEEKLYLCLLSLRERQSDRRFIDKVNARYMPGTEPGGAMRVNINPCLGSLLLNGFKYWKSEKSRGLLTPTGEVLQLKRGSGNGNMLRVCKPEGGEEARMEPSDCPIEHYYVGFEPLFSESVDVWR